MTRRSFTHPSVLDGIAAGASWADPIMDPARIDWAVRQANAAIPFRVVDGRPVNPCQRTDVRYGRNELGHWGELLATDALVSLSDYRRHRWIVMVERDDGHGWALPGGHVDPGESPVRAAVRELAEETGLVVPDVSWHVRAPRYVPDPRASDEAWMVTVVAHTWIGYHRRGAFPPVVGCDDARRALWSPADDYDVVCDYLADARGGVVFPAHRQILSEFLIEPEFEDGAA